MNRLPVTAALLFSVCLALFLSACGTERIVYVPVTVTPASDGVGAAPQGAATPSGMQGAPVTVPSPPESQGVPNPSAALPSAGAGRIAFMGPLGEGGPMHAFAVNADGSGLTLLSEQQGEGYFPNLSPDGSRVAYIANTAVDPDIFVTDIATGESVNLTNKIGFDTQPVWSPDGSQIAFISDREGGDVDMWLMNADGSEPRRLARSPGDETLGSWSPEGDKLAYSAADELGESLWILDIESGEATRLTENQSGSDSSPSWSPDGEQIAFYSSETGANPQVYTIRPDGSDRQQVTNGQFPSLVPNWSPDGEWLLYTTVTNGTSYDIVAMNIHTGDARTLPNVQGFPLSWRPSSDLLADTGLTQGPQQAGVEVDPAVLEAAYRRGSPDAPVTIVEFSDYQCPFCKSWTDQTLPSLESYIEDGTVQLIYVDFPLNIHPQAPAAAEAARCAGELSGDEGYWTMHDALFASMQQWSGQTQPAPIFNEVATAAGLDGEAIQACVESGRYSDEVQAGLQEGLRLGINGTPTFFVNGARIVGAQPFSAFESFLQGAQ